MNLSTNVIVRFNDSGFMNLKHCRNSFDVHWQGVAHVAQTVFFLNKLFIV